MKRLLLAMLFVLATAVAPAAHGAPGDAPSPAARADRQILLLLHLPAPHYRPEGYAGGYGDAAAHGARRRVAAALAREHGLTLAPDWALPLLSVDCYVMVVPPDQVLERVVQALSHDPRVAWAQAMNVYRTLGHNDPLYPLQPVTGAWHLSELHEIATGRGVRVAIVDSGVDAQHPDLAGQVEKNENFVDSRVAAPEQHGTAVAGIIAARADNGIGIVGVAPDVQLLALRACWQERGEATLCTSLSLAMALHFAIAHDAGVINLSLTGPRDRLLDKLLDAAQSRSITVVGAFDPAQADGGFPASHTGVVAVTDGAVVDAAVAARVLRAPGRDVLTTLPGGRWNLVSGASYAAAHVTGLIALVRELQAMRAGRSSVDELVSFPGGEIDACATLARVAGDDACGRLMTRSTPSFVHR
jgi:subtilisin family serine protease